MRYPDGYQPDEHRRALDAMLTDMFGETERQRSVLRTVRKAGRVPDQPGGGTGCRLVGETCGQIVGQITGQISSHTDAHTGGPTRALTGDPRLSGPASVTTRPEGFGRTPRLKLA